MADPAGMIHITSEAGRFHSAAATHPGTVRPHNEDAFVNRPDLGLWAVADGAGGHQAGEVAAAMVTQALEAVPAGLTAAELLAEVRQRMQAAHDAALAEGARRQGTVATTVVVLLASGDHFACLWAGDSRAYLLRHGALTLVSRDHSLVQDLVEAGAITADQAEGHRHANVITRAVGADTPSFELDKRAGTLLPGDRFLLCSDGVSKVLTEAALRASLAGDDAACALLKAALAAEARDNVTAVTIRLANEAAPGPA